jgi:branched-chain amino acid transport system ATP-binding protein
MAEPVLRSVAVAKHFGGLQAVGGVDLDLHEHEIHAVIGPNGAGKSTFLAMLAGDLAPSSGAVLLGGRDVTALSVERRVRLGIGRTYQRSAVIPGFTARDMVRLAAAHALPRRRLLAPLRHIGPVVDEADVALARVGLTDRGSVLTEALSHGERRRLEIAAVLAMAPHILLLDEPLAGLGPDEARTVVDLIAALRRECAVMLIEHDIDVVFALADRITVLESGRVLETGDPAAIRASAAVQDAYLGRGDET